MIWQKTKFFKMPFIAIGEWDLSTMTNYPHCHYLAADTETKLYCNDKLLNEQDAYDLYRIYGQKWFKCNVEVRAYAFMLSNGESFALFQCAEDFLTACAMFNVKKVFWYNAKFDFAIFDYFLLTNGWRASQDVIDENEERYRKLPDKTYQSLDGDFGQRYSMRIWKSYKNRNRLIKVHNFKMIDICNIYGGGLAKNLEDWDIRDKNGNPIRKLKMDYVEADIEDDIDYMIADTAGLYYLAEKIDKTIYEISGYSLFKGDYITAGGLAKKAYLSEMFNTGKSYYDIKTFKLTFPLSVEEDKDFREHNLYLGGKCFVNPYKRGKVQYNVFKYDVNSMYPDKMRNMFYPFGRPTIINKEENEKGYIYIYKIRNFAGAIKPNMIGVWQDSKTGLYTERIIEEDERYIWKEELDELRQYYNLAYEFVYGLKYKAIKPLGAQRFVDKFYKIKKENKGAIREGAKLFLNSSYGKLAQKVERVTCKYTLSEEGYVHLERGEVEIDEKSMLSVVVGSRITSLARVHLMYYIREICKGNPKEYFLYCDTDSVHALLEYDKCDSKALGMMKNEGTYTSAIYLAPKSYLLFDENDKKDPFEIHCKGVNIKVVRNEIMKLFEKDNNDNYILDNAMEKAITVFKADRNFKCLCGTNVKGGKALVYIDKKILNSKNLKEEEVKQDGLEMVSDYIY